MQNKSVALLHISHLGCHGRYCIFLFPGHLEFWTKFQILHFEVLGCTPLQLNSKGISGPQPGVANRLGLHRVEGLGLCLLQGQWAGTRCEEGLTY